MHRFANPRRFMSLANRAYPFFVLCTVGLMAAGLYFALFASPPDYQQGETVRIMYIHVPAAYMAVMIYAVMAAAGFVFLVWRHGLGAQVMRACAPIGMIFTLICLTTGALWGKPIWGTWWVWDARLTSVLLLLFLYIGYMALANAFEDPSRGERPSAILVLIGVINLPIIKFSVDWWHTLHQPASLFRLGGPTIDASMLWPLLLMIAGFHFLFLSIFVLRLRTELSHRKLRHAHFFPHETATGTPPYQDGRLERTG